MTTFARTLKSDPCSENRWSYGKAINYGIDRVSWYTAEDVFPYPGYNVEERLALFEKFEGYDAVKAQFEKHAEVTLNPASKSNRDKYRFCYTVVTPSGEIDYTFWNTQKWATDVYMISTTGSLRRILSLFDPITYGEYKIEYYTKSGIQRARIVKKHHCFIRRWMKEKFPGLD